MAVVKRQKADTKTPKASSKEPSVHDQLVQSADTWLKRQGCKVRITDRMRAATLSGEQPDNVGWRDGLSVMVECKTSRSDFLADRKKRFRDPGKGIGDWRFYLCPEGVIQPDELPDGWGLLWLKDGTVKAIKGIPANTQWWSRRPFTGDKHEETILLISALRRIEKAGYLDLIYEIR